MAWTSIGTLGSTNIKTTTPAGHFLDWSPSSDVPAGHVIVLMIATDSIFNLATDSGGPQHRRLYIADNAGNDWHQLGEASGTNCFFYCSALGGIFATQLDSPLLTTNVVSIYGGGLADVKVASGWEFTLPDGYGFATVDTQFSYTEDRFTDGGVGPISVAYAGTTERLMLHIMAAEGPLTDTYTWDADYTQFTADGTTGGAADENITLRAGWRIASLGGDTVSVTNTTAARDTIQVFGAIMPMFKPPTFPRTPILDNFNRAVEEPLDNGTWDTTVTAGPSSPGTRYLATDGDEAVAGSTGAGGQFWGEIFECDDVEVYATWSHVEDGSLEIDVIAHGSGNSHDANAEGYDAQIRILGGVGFSDPWAARMGYLGNQGGLSRDALFIWLSTVPTSGWKLGIQRLRDVNHLWLDKGSGWIWRGAIITERGDRPHSGKIGLQIWDALSRVDDFGGGETCYVINMNWRSASRYKTATRTLLNPSDVRPGA